jgi:putative heme-binding domain-containing protein
MRSFLLRRCSSVVVAVALVAVPIVALLNSSGQTTDKNTPHKLTLRKGDRIAIIGNTLAERMQHDGWLEAYLHTRFPEHDLSVRNLGFSGDELTLRIRSFAFGTPDEWLARHKSDVVFAFFGYNESFGDRQGLNKFKSDLEDFIKKTLARRYNGTSAPRLVLFSPIAHEKLPDPNLPAGAENNRRIELYTDAMAAIARVHKIPFVDLYHPTKTLFAREKGPFTINGVHLTERGNEAVAKIIDETLFAGKLSEPRDPKRLDKVRQAVVRKNYYWFHRYRTTDGYSIYGQRADLRFLRGQTNREVMQREMEVLDVMTANRDRRIWTVARGSDLKVDDSNTPPFIPVETNKPGPLPGGKHVFLDPEKAIEKMTVAKGMKVNLFASEKQFPELVNPVQMSWDTKGRLWVAVWPTYPHWKPKEAMNDKILILEDTNGDGKADKCTPFAENLHCPTGFEFYNGGVLVAQCPDLWFLKDTDGDGKADVRTRVLGGLDSADTHHASNSFTLDPGGALYFQEGTFHHTQVETPHGPSVRCANAGVFRYEPRSQKFEVYVSFGFANPHGHIFDRWGRDIVIDGTSSNPYDAALFSGHLPFPHKHAHPPQVWKPKTRPCPGMEILSSRHFPQDMQGHVLVANVIGVLGILRYKIEDDGGSYIGLPQESILTSTDQNFRPSDLKIGPDGALYFLDWHNPIIGHMQHNLRDPSRDREHGRIYRVSYPSRPLLKPVNIADESIETLLERLKEPEDRVRYRARIELAAQPTDKVIAAARKWIAGLDTTSGAFEHQLLEGLWLHQSHNVVDGSLLKRVLNAKEARARAAATRLIGYWRDRLPDALDLLRKLAADEHPRVRLEAVRAASFFTEPEAIEVVLVATEKPADQYINFVRSETMRALEPHVKKAIAEGKRIQFTTPAGARYFLRTVSTDDLLKMERTQGVYLELLFRKGVREEFRKEALGGLARIEKKDELRVLLDAIRDHDAQDRTQDDESVAFDLVRLLTARPQADLQDVRSDLERLATSARQGVIRELGYVALIDADGSADRTWALAIKSTRGLADFVHAVPMIRDPGHRAGLYPKIAGLLDNLPKELAVPGAEKSVTGRYVRIELPGKLRTLTLAEVEVFADGINVARRGKATQSSTAHGGEARRGIDGNTSGSYGDGGQTHTREGTNNPWWEVDLGQDQAIQSIVVWNRTDGALGSRLKNYTLKILDRDRKVSYQKARNPAPEVKETFAVGSLSPARQIRRAAMQALPSMRGQEGEAVKALARFVKDESDRPFAVQALSRIPNRQWPTEQVQLVLADILAHVRKVPVTERTGPAVVDALQLADTLAALLPIDQARKMRKELGELGVRVIRLGTVIEQMIYDKERIVVQANKPFEIQFDNTDTMPHNLVFIEPGALEEIGELAEKTATQPGALERHYVPVSKKVLFKSQLIQPRQSQRLSWTAPARPGIYPYVCTYPGHWRRMHGALYVVADLEAYQADPEAYLAKNPLPIVDPLLKFNRPRKEWKLEDLESSVKTLSGRSFTNGKQMFTVGACISCHKFGGGGQEYGPDLTKLDPKWTNIDVIKHILDPALKIDDKYRTWTFELTSGKSVTGMILEESAAEVKVIENPLATGSKPLVLKPGDIDKRGKSPNSLMPKGLLDKMTREEILDLVAYLLSGANPKHKVFQGAHDHGH